MQLTGGQGATDAAAFRAGPLDKLPRVPHSLSATIHPFPSPMSRGASDFPCLISPSLLPKGALSTSLANPEKVQLRCTWLQVWGGREQLFGVRTQLLEGNWKRAEKWDVLKGFCS